MKPDPAAESVLRELPESFWDVAVWRNHDHYQASLDVADRKRIVKAVLRWAALLNDGDAQADA